MNMVMRVYRNVLLKNPGNREDMLMFADMLEDRGAIDLAHAYRWAANFKVGEEYRPRWPFTRHRWYIGKNVCKAKHYTIHDWGTEGRAVEPEASRLPSLLYKRMLAPFRRAKATDYGGVNRAFVLLAKTLKGFDNDITLWLKEI